MTNLLISLMSDLPMHPIPECLRLFQINRDGPATVSCAEGARCSSPARQRGAPLVPCVQALIWVIRVALTVRRTLPVFLCEQTSAAPVGMSQRCRQQRTFCDALHYVPRKGSEMGA